MKESKKPEVADVAETKATPKGPEVADVAETKATPKKQEPDVGGFKP